jgi:hypothetical protein
MDHPEIGGTFEQEVAENAEIIFEGAKREYTGNRRWRDTVVTMRSHGNSSSGHWFSFCFRLNVCKTIPNILRALRVLLFKQVRFKPASFDNPVPFAGLRWG